MACAACGNKARAPRTSPFGQPVNQGRQPARTAGPTTNADRGKSRITNLRWNQK